MRALILKEIRAFLGSVIGYVFILIFLIMCWLFLWMLDTESNLLSGGVASLGSFFYVAPMVLIILVPAITMRSFAEEKRTGTIELLHSRPLSTWNIIFAKYLGALAVLAVALLPTLVYYVSMYYLGDPVGIVDTGASIGSYIGLFCMGAVFTAIGIFASSLTSSQIIAFIYALFMCWFLFIGIDTMATFADFGNSDYLVKYIGLKEHYTSIQRGVVDSRDIIFFLAEIVLFLLATNLVLKSRKWS